MQEFDYFEPASVQEACGLMAQYGDECRAIAGGTALMLAMRQGMLSPKCLISLARLRDLRGISFDEKEGLRIGALTLHAEVARSAIIQDKLPMLSDMAAHVANPQVRNQGTIGGNLCYADPATDPPSCLLALDAKVIVEGRGRRRALAVDEFLVDYYSTALEPDELVTAIVIPPPRFTVGRHVRYLRTNAEHRPLVNLAVTLTYEGDVLEEARIVIGAATPVPTRMHQCESLLVKSGPTKEAIAEVADLLSREINAVSDFRGGGDYRRQVAKVLCRRTLSDLSRHPETAEEAL